MELTPGDSQDQADAQRGEKLTFQGIHIKSFLVVIVNISFKMSETGFGIS
jgi:hypothetical protein